MKRQLPGGGYTKAVPSKIRKGKNSTAFGSPRSVLAFIEAHLDRKDPPSVEDLGRELGYSSITLHKLKMAHGPKLTDKLLEERRRRTEKPRFMAKQQGQAHPDQYTASVHGAIDDAEAIDLFTEKRLKREARLREEQDLADRLAALENVEAALTTHIKARGEIAGEMRRARAQVKRARAKLLGQMQASDRAA